MELSSVLSKVRKLIERAEYEGTSEEDRKLYNQMADDLMAKYNVDQANLDMTRKAEDRAKPDTIVIPLVGDPGLMGYMADLARYVAAHCDCRIREYFVYRDGEWHSKIYGYIPDLRYYEILYTTLRLHMVGALRPKIDPAKSVGENAYNLHHSGMNWFDIAKMEGWEEVPPLPGETKFMYRNVRTGERQKWADCIGKWKRGYADEIARRGEQPLRIRPGGMASFRVYAAYGYVTRINQRLTEIREGRAVIGTALAMRVDILDQMFRDDNPELFKTAEMTVSSGRRPAKVKTIPFDSNAYEAGMRHANTAGLNPATSHNPTKEIG